MYALGHLEALVHHGELPEADHKEVATVIAHDGVLSI